MEIPGSFLPQNQIHDPATLGMPYFLPKVMAQVGMAGFFERIAQRQAAILASVQRFGQLPEG